MLVIGSHVSMAGPDFFLGSVKEALSYDANAMMIYTGAPQNTVRLSTDKLKISEAHALLNENGILLRNVVVHAPYIMNLANPDEHKFQFSVDFLTDEMRRTAAFGISQIVLHPGAHVGEGATEGIKRVIKGLNTVLRNTKGLNVKIALETMAGKGTELGRNFEELYDIIEGTEENERLSVCFDTCHTHDAGYRIKDDFDGVIREFDQIVGISRISVFHINDSKNPLLSHKDRHENIGYGYIGFKTLNEIVRHPQFSDIPKILETPYYKNAKNVEFSPYQAEIRNFRENSFIDIKNL